MAEIRTAVLDGNSYYFLRLEGDEVFYSLSASQNRDVVTLNVGDTVTIDHAIPAEGEQPSILDGYTLTIDGRTSSNHMGFTVDGNSAPTIDSESQDIPSALDPAPQT